MKTRLLFAMVTLLLSSRLSAATITLGASVQHSGPLANTGRYYSDAYEFAVDQINQAGGVKIGDTHEKISLKLLDNQSDVNLSVRQYVQLSAAGQGQLPARALRQQFRRWPTPRLRKNTRCRWSRAAARRTRSTAAAINTSSARCRRRTIISTARSRPDGQARSRAEVGGAAVRR